MLIICNCRIPRRALLVDFAIMSISNKTYSFSATLNNVSGEIHSGLENLSVIQNFLKPD